MVMKIPVIFINGTFGAICGEDLDEMLEKKLIVAFQRASGLTIVGRDELRSNRGDGNGSWRNRKNNHRPPEKVIFLPQRAECQSLFVYDVTRKRIVGALTKELPIAVNQR